MTLVISAVNDKGAWQVSDRRLTDEVSKYVLSDEAIKTIRLDLHDGKVLVGYSGIGRVGDRQISEWIKRLLRGRRMTYKEARNRLAAAATRRLTPLKARVHEFAIVGTVKGVPK